MRLAAEYLEIDLYLGLVCFCPPWTAHQTSSVTIWNRISEDNQINPVFADSEFQTCKLCFDNGDHYQEKVPKYLLKVLSHFKNLWRHYHYAVFSTSNLDKDLHWLPAIASLKLSGLSARWQVVNDWQSCMKLSKNVIHCFHVCRIRTSISRKVISGMVNFHVLWFRSNFSRTMHNLIQLQHSSGTNKTS